MAAQNKVKAIPLTAISATTLSPTYQAINPDGLPEACFLIRIVNTSSQTIGISYDGVDAHDNLLTLETLQLNFQTNSQPSSRIASLAKGQIIYINGQPGTGTIYLSGYYVTQ